MKKLIEKAADTVIVECLVEHGEHALGAMLPNAIDGLKPVQRRIVTCHSSGETAKAPKVVGKVLDWHPHGDAAIAGAIVKLAQPHKSLISIMTSSSNTGTYNGDEAAAPRYFDVGISDIAKYAYFKNIDHSVFVKVPNETGNGTFESKYLVPRIPMALSVSGFGIAFGYSSEPSNLSLFDMLNVAEVYIKTHKGGLGPKTEAPYFKKLAKYLVPEFPIKQHIRNRRQLIAGYKKGNFSIPMVLDGELVLTETKLIIKTLPYGTYPKDVVTKIGKELVSSTPTILNSHFSQIEDYSKQHNCCNIILTLKRNVNIFDALQVFTKQLAGTRNWVPRNLYVIPTGKVSELNPLQLINIWYVQRVRFLKAELSKAQHSMTRQLRVLEALIKIGDRIKEVVNLLLELKSSEAAVPVLCKKYGLTITQAHAILKFKLSNIPKQDKKKLDLEHRALVAQLFEVQHKFLNPDKVLLNDIAKAKKDFKHLDKVNSYEIKFLGVVIFSSGYVQFETYDELRRLITSMSGVTSVVLYGDNSWCKATYGGSTRINNTLVDLPKQMATRGLYLAPRVHKVDNPCVGTLIMSKSSNIGMTKPFHLPKPKYKHLLIPKHSRIVGIDLKSKKLVEVANMYTLNKTSVDTSGNPTIKTKLLGVGILSQTSVGCWVAYSNTVNQVVLHKWNGEPIVDIIGRSTFLGIFELGQPIYISIPKSITSTTIKHIVISDVSKLHMYHQTIYLCHKCNGLHNGKVHGDALMDC